MKKTWPLWIILVFTYSVNGQSLLEQKVSVVCENLPLEKALFKLIDQSDVALSFSNKIIPLDKYITCNVVERPLKEVMDIFLDSTSLTYMEVGSQIILLKQSNELQRYTLSGFLKDKESGENIIGAVVYDPFLKIGTYTNEFGFYSITYTEGDSHVTFSNLGYESFQIDFFHNKNQRLDIELSPIWLRPVLVNFFNDSTFVNHSPNTYDLNIEQLRRMVALGGETDLVRSVFALPGVQTGADGFGGIAIRGGDIDQNLFLLDGVPVYNAMHGIGLFSIYNTSAIRGAKVLKGSFPARYGGRMSSVWDVQTKEGNKEKMAGEVDIGITSAKLTLEGPIKKGKGSFFFSGRRALFDFYSEPISRRLRGNNGYVSYHFDDLNMKFNYSVSKKDRLYISYYSGSDDYDDYRLLDRNVNGLTSSFGDSEKVDWGNDIASFRWNHLFTDKVFGNTILTYSSYSYASEDLVDLIVSNPTDTLNRDIFLQLYSSDIKDVSLKSDFDYAKFSNHKIKFGGQLIRHEFSSKIATFEEAQRIDFIDRDTIGDYANRPLYTNELEFYAEDEIGISDQLRANIGLRVSSSNVLDKWLVLTQPRLLITFTPTPSGSYYLSINRMTQFLHLLSPSRLGLPKDLWVTSTKAAPPQDSWQFNAGLSKKLKRGFTFNIDLFYKQLYNQLYFKAPIVEINTRDWQNEVSIGNGKSLGAEFLLQKQGKKWGGWLGYTLSKSNRQFPEDINFGKSFPIKLDRRHNLNLQLVYKLNSSWDFATSFTIASGSNYSLPTQEYTVIEVAGIPTQINPIPIPEGVNDRKLAAYHRFDLSASYQFRGKVVNHSVKLGVTNLYNRLNPLFRTLRAVYDDNGNVSQQFVEVSLLPIFPSIRYLLELE